MHLPIEGLRNRHRGRPAVVLGSGPSLPADLAAAPPEAVWLAVNARPAQLVHPDFVVFTDACEGPACTALGVPRVSTLREWSDFSLSSEAWDGGFSSSLGAWLALHLGCRPVLLAGMDCYRGAEHYFDGGVNAQQAGYPLHFHLRAWAPAVVRCPGAAHDLRALSGPLTHLFGAWPQEWTP